MDRCEFAKAMTRLRLGMSPAAVRSILGPPDMEIFHDAPQDDPELRPSVWVERKGRPGWASLWEYGTPPGSTFGTLGRVLFGLDMRVTEVRGDPNCGDGRGSEIQLQRVAWYATHTRRLAEAMPEAELRQVLKLLNSLPDWVGTRFDPHALVRVVNRLLELPSDLVPSLLFEFLRVVGFDYDLRMDSRFPLLLRCLFAEPTDERLFPQVRHDLGALPRPPFDSRSMLRFPLVEVDQVPLHVVVRYQPLLSTGPAMWRPFLNEVVEGMELRSAPLRPTASPAKVLAEFEAKYLAPEFGWIQSEQERAQVLEMIAGQLQRWESSARDDAAAVRAGS